MKNEKLSGGFSPSSSTSVLITQALHCVQTQVLNPTTNRKELPHKVVVLSTYPIPDHAVADASRLLDEFNRKCRFVGPEEFVQLLKEHANDLFLEFAHPGEGVFRAIRRHVVTHHEAPAFDLLSRRRIAEFFVNIGITQTESVLGQLLSGRLRPTKLGKPTIPKRVYTELLGLYSAISVDLDHAQILELAPSSLGIPAQAITKERTVDRLDCVNLKQINIETFLEHVRNRIHEFQTVFNGCKSRRQRVGMAARAIDFLRCANDATRYIYEYFKDDLIVQSPSVDIQHAETIVFNALDPETLLKTRENVCIVGGAGAGKTCFARILAQKAIDSGLRCVYFPCSRLQGDSDRLDTEIGEFLRSLMKEESPESIESVMQSIDLLILDGCDEARTFGDQLGADVRNVCSRHILNEKVASESRILPVVPEDLTDAVKYHGKRKKGAAITVHRAISQSDYARLIACNAETPFEAVVQRLADKAKKVRPRIVLTSRIASPLQLPSTFQCIELRSFNNDQLRAFFCTWFKDTKKDYRHLLKFLSDNPRVKEICRTPLNATIIAAPHENDYDLPRSRVEIYQKRFDLLLDRWDRMRGVASRTTVNRADKLRFLARIALRLHLDHARRFTITQAERVWNRGFSRLYEGCRIQDVLAELRDCNGLVFSEGTELFSLGHLSYQEYLAAHAVVLGQRLEILLEHVFDPWWRGVLVFYAGISGDIGKFLNALQTRAGIHDIGGLLDEMMHEARY